MEITSIPASTATAGDDLSTQNAGTEQMSQFLRLLTAQIENQDPLEPLDANQFIEQLATINSLEQQIETNGHLEEIIGMLRNAE